MRVQITARRVFGIRSGGNEDGRLLQPRRIGIPGLIEDFGQRVATACCSVNVGAAREHDVQDVGAARDHERSLGPSILRVRIAAELEQERHEGRRAIRRGLVDRRLDTLVNAASA